MMENRKNQPHTTMLKIIILDGVCHNTNTQAENYLKEVLPQATTIFLKEPDPLFSKALKDSRGKISKQDEYLLIWASRYHVWVNEILPHANSDMTVVIRRSYAATYAYQIEGRDIPEFANSFFFHKNTLLGFFDDSNTHIHHLYLRMDLVTALNRRGIVLNTPEGLMLRSVRTGYDLFYQNSRHFARNEQHDAIDVERDMTSQIRKVLGLL